MDLTQPHSARFNWSYGAETERGRTLTDFRYVEYRTLRWPHGCDRTRSSKASDRARGVYPNVYQVPAFDGIKQRSQNCKNAENWRKCVEVASAGSVAKGFDSRWR